MNKIMIGDVTNEMYNLLKWLKANVSTDKSRENWQGIHIKNNGTIFEATTGFSLVIARLSYPLHDKLTVGTLIITTLTKKIIVLEEIDVNFLDTSIILTDYDKPITDTQTFTTLNPEFLYSVISGFDTFDLNLVTNNRPVQIVLHSISMPIGTYVAIVMPYYSDANFTTIQSDIRAVKDK
jgi:hypothetical protein